MKGNALWDDGKLPIVSLFLAVCERRQMGREYICERYVKSDGAQLTEKIYRHIMNRIPTD